MAFFFSALVLISLVCVHSVNMYTQHLINGTKLFLKEAYHHAPISDKVSPPKGYDLKNKRLPIHNYQLMFGMFLMPVIGKLYHEHGENHTIKLLEIGLGCQEEYGTGASIKLWRNILGPLAEIWIGEYNENCVNKLKDKLESLQINTLLGDQKDRETLDRWIIESKGQFDVIIDDGGHKSDQILSSVYGLWDSLKDGGLYFIEDLHIQKYKTNNTSKYLIPTPTEVIQHWIAFLHYGGQCGHTQNFKDDSGGEILNCNKDDMKFWSDYPLPANMSWIFCQQHACVFGKNSEERLLLD